MEGIGILLQLQHYGWVVHSQWISHIEVISPLSRPVRRLACGSVSNCSIGLLTLHFLSVGRHIYFWGDFEIL